MSHVLVSLRVVAAPQHAFHVFVHEISEWWRPNDLFRFERRGSGVLAFEPQLGGRLMETLADGGTFEIGRITTWEPGKRLGFTWRQEGLAPDQMTHVEVRFEPVGTETRVTVEHLGWDSVPQEHAVRHGFPDAIFLQRLGEWWQMLLAAMARHGARR